MRWKSYKCTSITLHDRPIKSYKPFPRWTCYRLLVYNDKLHLPVYPRLNHGFWGLQNLCFLPFAKWGIFFRVNNDYLLCVTTVASATAVVAVAIRHNFLWNFVQVYNHCCLSVKVLLIENNNLKGKSVTKRSCWIEYGEKNKAELPSLNCYVCCCSFLIYRPTIKQLLLLATKAKGLTVKMIWQNYFSSF